MPPKLYYYLKPYIPWEARIALRRLRAKRLRKTLSGSWPVLESAGQTPAGWCGWPGDKRFAVVITHDVEGEKGVNRCAALDQLDQNQGFRSAFNFIPEGDYRVPADLRGHLEGRGAEIGVHDLEHDGFLYRSHENFRSKAPRINRYLKEWNAKGFRSGFMHHNLDWYHDLDVLYDASTFDTDPFEPQPDGVGTIFPFWVPGPRGGGYVELPYTLIQDFNLFTVLQERTIDIWRRKLDWIAAKGGMALFIVHPDYVNFGDTVMTRDEFPVRLYEEFLSYIRTQYAGQYWQALPYQVAEMVRDHQKIPADIVTRPKVSASNGARKAPIWIDLDNTPHVVFFEPIIEELKNRGYSLVVTARDAFQVCELADKRKLSYVPIGRHYGKNRVRKAAGLLYRAMQLAPLALRERPVLSVSHGARSQIIISNLMGIPTLLLADYEYAKYPPLMRPTWEMVPDVIPDSSLCCEPGHVRKYPGIKEDVYVWKFKPDAALLKELGLKASELIITARPPATEAHYHNPESEQLFVEFMEMACRHPQSRVVLMPRNKKQGEHLRQSWPHWFENNKTVVPRGAIDGLNLIWHSDLLVSGGGTMNREAAALGVPVYSIFRGATGAVDRHLEKEGRLTMISSKEEVLRKIRLEKRPSVSLSDITSRRSLEQVVNTIEELAERVSISRTHNGK